MKKTSAKNSLPAVKSGDVMEAFEMLRATLTLLRQAFGIVFMTGSIADPILSDTEMKEFAVQFDDVVKVLRNAHESLSKKYQELKSKES